MGGCGQVSPSISSVSYNEATCCSALGQPHCDSGPGGATATGPAVRCWLRACPVQPWHRGGQCSSGSDRPVRAVDDDLVPLRRAGETDGASQGDRGTGVTSECLTEPHSLAQGPLCSRRRPRLVTCVQDPGSGGWSEPRSTPAPPPWVFPGFLSGGRTEGGGQGTRVALRLQVKAGSSLPGTTGGLCLGGSREEALCAPSCCCGDGGGAGGEDPAVYPRPVQPCLCPVSRTCPSPGPSLPACGLRAAPWAGTRPPATSLQGGLLPAGRLGGHIRAAGRGRWMQARQEGAEAAAPNRGAGPIPAQPSCLRVPRALGSGSVAAPPLPSLC